LKANATPFAFRQSSALAMLGLLPMGLSHGIGSETQKPLAVVIIGGLISATLLTLIVLPTLYLVFEGGGKRRLPVPGTRETGTDRESAAALQGVVQ